MSAWTFGNSFLKFDVGCCKLSLVRTGEMEFRGRRVGVSVEKAAELAKQVR